MPHIVLYRFAAAHKLTSHHYDLLEKRFVVVAYLVPATSCIIGFVGTVTTSTFVRGIC